MSGGNRSSNSSLNLVKRLGRIAGLALTAVSLFFRALSRGKQTQPAQRGPVIARAVPPEAPPQAASAPSPAAHADDTPAGIHMPPPTIWPLVLSLALTLIALGVVTNLIFSILGIVCLIWAIVGWVGDLRHG